MTIDYQQVIQKIREISALAKQNGELINARRHHALKLLNENANQVNELQHKVEQACEHDPNLRCAFPVIEALDASFKLPDLPPQLTVIAADGSQINPDRHAALFFSLINVGAIVIEIGSGKTPDTFTFSDLKYGEELYSETGLIGEDLIALGRDLAERQKLLDLAEQYPAPMVALTDGPMEVWGPKGGNSDAYRQTVETHLVILSRLQDRDVTLGGVVDKPGANLVVRLLEIADTHVEELKDIRKKSSLRGVSDLWLFEQLLSPGERSAVFGLQSSSRVHYKGGLALHFFYLNTSRDEYPNLVRVEIPGWVAQNKNKLDMLHASLIAQCRILGSTPYPYILHRAHELAVVSFQDKQQVEQLLMVELNRAGVELGEPSSKQIEKDLPGRGSK
ncbi:MAG: DNA double-strand break repair nuclease NurA [Chloroflexota bacterium]